MHVYFEWRLSLKSLIKSKTNKIKMHCLGVAIITPVNIQKSK